MAIDGPVLIIAGPGSGKTATLTRRIAYMIYSGIKPENILAVTFTNKSAKEMQERINNLLDIKNRYQRQPLIGTFHSTCAKILRNEARVLGFTKNFTIYDEEDQLSLVKKVMEDLGFSSKNFNLYSIINRISKLKSELNYPENYEKQVGSYYEKIVSQIYNAYQRELQKTNAMDFDDLIMLTVKLFQENPETLEKYQNQFKYILVDEYQDTNISQYVLTKLLAAKYKNLFAIGDTDQSIYTWRYADFRNMLNFEKDFPQARIIRLEQNYRSTKAILTAGQGLIKNNIYRHEKDLWTENAEGEKISISQLEDEKEEAQFIIEKMKEMIKKGYKLNDFVILYRTHAQSRPLEEEFLTQGFPYKIVGALKFYERKEIKDIIAYLRILANPNDFVGLQRVYNVPPRGIGKAAFVRLADFARKNNFNLFNALLKAKDIENVPAKSKFALYAFGKTLEKIGQKIKDYELTKLIKFIVNEIGYKEYLDVATEEGYMRWENIKELFTVAKKYNSLKTNEAMNKFLEEVALIQETDPVRTKTSNGARNIEDKNLIYMMTLHSAKGLEFPAVFLVGAEEGLLPHSKSLSNPIELEEERRLCYVGITRAKRRVFITFARSRTIFGTSSQGIPSRFLGEIPEEVIELDSGLKFFDKEKIIEYT